MEKSESIEGVTKELLPSQVLFVTWCYLSMAFFSSSFNLPPFATFYHPAYKPCEKEINMLMTVQDTGPRGLEFDTSGFFSRVSVTASVHLNQIIRLSAELNRMLRRYLSHLIQICWISDTSKSYRLPALRNFKLTLKL